MEVKHGRGYVYAIEYHLVWCVKYRHKVLREEVAGFLREVLTETAIFFYKFRVESLEIVEDHVHVLVSATPQHTIPNMVKVLKGISARKPFLQFPQLKQKLWGGHVWNPSYFVGTVSAEARRGGVSPGEDSPGEPPWSTPPADFLENTEAQVKKYIESQNDKSPESV